MATATYYRAISTLANKIKASKLLFKINLSEIIESEMLWDLVVEQLPEIKNLAIEVEKELSYELSYNQLCNAIGWVYKYHASEWNRFLMDTPVAEEVDVFSS